MLVLNRKIGESLLISESITVVVLDVDCNVVKIGIEAPLEMKVHRSEVYERLQPKKQPIILFKKNRARSLK